MAAREMPPRGHKAAGVADPDEATTLPEEEPDPSAIGGLADARLSRSRRAMRVAVIVFVALGTGQFLQSYRPDAAVHAAAFVPPKPAHEALAPQSVAAVVLTPVKLPVLATVTGPASEALGDATPGGGAEDAAAPDGVAPAECGARLTVTAEPGAVLALGLSAPCDGGERVVLHHAGLAVTGKLDHAGHLALNLPALAADGAVSVEFEDGQRLRGAAAVPGLAGLRRVALQWRSGEEFALHGLKDGAALGTAGDVSDAHPGVSAGRAGWLARLGAADVDQPMLAEVFTYPADATKPVDAAIVARVAPGSCGRQMLAQAIASSGGRARLTDLTLVMPSCGGSAGYVVLRNLFADMQMAASK